MLIFQSPLLPGLHGVTVINPRPSGAVRSCLHAVRIGEFRSPVGKQDVDIFPEELRAKDGLQQVDALLHGKSRFFLMEEGEEEVGADKLKSLDKRAVRAIVIDGIHLGDKDLRMIRKISPVVLIKPVLEISAVISLFEALRLLFRELSGNLPSEIQDGNVRDLLKDTAFDVIVKSLFADPQFRMAGDDLVRGLSLFKERGDGLRHGPGLRGCEVDALPGIRKGSKVVVVCIFGAVLVLVEPAVRPVGTAIAGARGAVTPGAAERSIFRAVRSTLAFKGAFAVRGAFKGKAALMSEFPVSLDLLANSGLVLADGLGDGSFGRAIGDPGKDDAAFF